MAAPADQQKPTDLLRDQIAAEQKAFAGLSHRYIVLQDELYQSFVRMGTVHRDKLCKLFEDLQGLDPSSLVLSDEEKKSVEIFDAHAEVVAQELEKQMVDGQAVEGYPIHTPAVVAAADAVTKEQQQAKRKERLIRDHQLLQLMACSTANPAE